MSIAASSDNSMPGTSETSVTVAPRQLQWPTGTRFDPAEFFAANNLAIELPELQQICTCERFLYLYGVNTACVQCQFSSPDVASIIVAVSGLTRQGWGIPEPTASIGAWFGRMSVANLCQDLRNQGHDTTADLATLIAALRALQTVEGMREHGFVPEGRSTRPWKVIIKSDSAYLVTGMTEYLSSWEADNFTLVDGRRVPHGRLWQRLKALVHNLYHRRVDVLFWLVPKIQNLQADALAHHALNRLFDQIHHPTGLMRRVPYSLAGAGCAVGTCDHMSTELRPLPSIQRSL